MGRILRLFWTLATTTPIIIFRSTQKDVPELPVVYIRLTFPHPARTAPGEELVVGGEMTLGSPTQLQTTTLKK